MTIYTAAMLIEIVRKKSQQFRASQEAQPQTPARDAGHAQTHAAKPDLAFAAASR